MSSAFLGDLTLLAFTLGCGVCGGLAWRWLRLLNRRYAGASPVPSRLLMLRSTVALLCCLFALSGCVSWMMLSPGCTSFLEISSVQDDFHLVSDRMNLAVNRGDVAAVKSMLAHGADPNGWCWDPVEDWQHLRAHPLLTEAAYFQWPSSLELMQLLLDHGANPNKRRRFGSTALGLAVRSGNVSGVRLLLEHGANPNLSEEEWHDGNRDMGLPLEQARASKNQVLVRLLKLYGAHD